MRAVIYARYSSDLQSAASIEDQIRLCRERIEQENGTVVDVYADYAISGSSLRNRPRMQTLLEEAKKGKFDCVIAEALDRVSRDQEDIAAIYKRLRHSDIRFLTLAEGEISELHVGLKGTMNASVTGGDHPTHLQGVRGWNGSAPDRCAAQSRSGSEPARRSMECIDNQRQSAATDRNSQ
jgi:hypothetical protein